MIVVWILGAPATGKSTLVKSLLGSQTHVSGRWTVGTKCAAPGPYTVGLKDGADAVLTSVLGSVPSNRILLLDGERYAQPWAADLMRPKATLIAVLLEAPIPTLQARRAWVSDDWMRCHIGRAERFANTVGRVFKVDATQSADLVCMRVREAIHV